MPIRRRPQTHAYKRERQEAAYSLRRGKWRDVELLEFHELVPWLLTSRCQRCIRAPCHLNLPSGQIPSDFLHEIKKFSHSAIKSPAQTVCSLLAHSLVCLGWGRRLIGTSYIFHPGLCFGMILFFCLFFTDF